MKFIYSLLIVTFVLNPVLAQDYTDYYSQGWMGIGGGMGGMGGGAAPGGYNFQTNGQNSVPVFDVNMDPTTVTSYKTVKVNSKCPLLTTTSQDDQDLFSDLRSFLSTASKNPKCSLAQDPMMNAMGRNNVTMLENLLNGGTGSPMNGSVISGSSVKCYSANVELIGQRNLAYYYSEKNMAQGGMTPFSSCIDLRDEMYESASLEKKRECIAKKYDEAIEENKVVCREMVAPQAVQKQVNQGLVGIEQLLNQALANKEECGFKSQDLFKVTMNTFLKASSLSVVGPWGAAAGFGAELVGNLLDKLFPSDSQKAADLMAEILNEETFEQNACLYYNIQQKMYCEERPIEIATPNPSCQNIAVSSDLLSLLQKYKDIKKVTDTYNDSPKPTGGFNAFPGTAAPTESNLSPAMENALLEHYDDLAKYALANEADLQERINSLPKMQRSREKLKLDKFMNTVKAYQAYDPSSDVSGQEGKKIIGDLSGMFMSKNPEVQLDLSMFIVRTTPGTKLESIRQRSIANTVEQMMAAKGSGSQPESSRTMARYNKYKVGMGNIAKAKFESRLDKQFNEFQTQVKFVNSQDRGIVKDAVAEGQLRNLIRHCSLLQEIYDPGLEGKMPAACQKLSCSTNKLGWFKPEKNKANLSSFKQQYCDKSLTFQKTEDDYIKELKDPNGAKICGTKVENFF
ncbi:hypothetical protein SHI21_03200 [Bacteriovorax sp. PP10]|uniref:Uncharacterized protein n=1 Tax=Bacteriovorax antarcticus TaxID=3088717 RepID=A0ABU5VRE4_9BACT|nr:hypothetical protein [Bacteriovorax sp. PP10]MEA9355187.1 hypothetical protein [Bacteriovorax sp. PP10]